MYRAGSVRSILSEEYELELGGHTVYPGSKVNVRWKGTWCDGTISKIGPRRQMCKVRDLASNHTLLMERLEIKLMDSLARYAPGSRVAYNDGSSWAEGVIESNNCVGAAQVSWRPNVYTMNENWFEIADLAPIIDNEAYVATNEDLLTAQRSGLLQNDTIEPLPKERENVLYESDDSDPLSSHRPLSPVSRREEEHFYHVLDENQPPQHRIPLTTQHTYESIPDNDKEHDSYPPKSPRSPLSSKYPTAKKKRSHKRSQPEYPAHTLPHPHSFPIPPPPPQPYFPPPFIAGPWGMYQTNPYQPAMYPPMPPYSPQRKPVSPVKLPPNKRLEQTSLPCAWSYSTHYHNGIPPHSSSTFFQGLGKLSAPIRNRSKVMPQKLSFPIKNLGDLKKSPSNVSNAASEPVYSEVRTPYLSTVEAIPRRDITGKSLFSRRTKERKPKIPKIEEEDLRGEVTRGRLPAPYEVPVKADLSTEKEEVDGAKETNTKKSKKSPKKKSPKGKSSDKDDSKALVIDSSSPPSVSTSAGGTALLTCISTGGKKLSYQWRVGEEKLPSKAHPNKIVTAPGILEVRKCTPSDEGLYSCTVSNKWGTSTRSFQLTVVGDISRSPSGPSGFPSSPQVAVPAGGVSGLQSSFNSKVTYAELNLPPMGEDGSYEPESVQQFLDSLVEEIHISDDEFNLDHSFFDKEQLSNRPPGDGQAVPEKEKDTPLPQIIVTEPSKSTRLKHKRLSNAIKNDNEDYLIGYGQDYGAVSMATDLEKEGLTKFPAKDIAKKLKERDKKKSSPERKAEKPKKKFSLFTRSAKKDNKDLESSDVLKYKDMPSPTRVQFADQRVESRVGTPTKRGSGHTETNSMGVNTSLGSEHSESSQIGRLENEGGMARERLQLPTEEATISEQVERLQRSVQEYRKQEMSMDKGKKIKGVFAKLAKRTKS